MKKVLSLGLVFLLVACGNKEVTDAEAKTKEAADATAAKVEAAAKDVKKEVKKVAASGLTEKKVQAFLDDFEKASFKDQDIEKMGTFLSNNFTVSVMAPGLVQPMTMNKEQYLQTAEMTWSMVEDYEYKLSDQKITLNGNSATVSAKQTESMTMMGQTVAMETDSVTDLELKDGKILITKMKADSKEM